MRAGHSPAPTNGLFLPQSPLVHPDIAPDPIHATAVVANDGPDAHLAVARRPGGRLPARGPVAELLQQARVDGPEGLAGRLAGGVVLVDLPGLEVSATRIRALLAAGRDPRWLLPDPVLEIIRERGLYLARN